jgi:glycosyltransferase involved in cell wall biosynthesis
LNIKVIIPAFNEALSITQVIKAIPALVDEVIVVNNGSTDHTKDLAEQAGATVLNEPRKGYGYACLKGMDYISKMDKKPDIIVFLDGDFSDYPEELTKIVAPIVDDTFDFVIGARVKQLREQGSMTPQQIFGNWLATTLMRSILWSQVYRFGPF